MHSLTVRKATHDDLPILLQFEQGVIAAERPFDPTIKSGNIRYYDLETMRTSPDVCLVVAEHNGKIVGSGYARLQMAKPFYQYKKYAYLGFMYVLPEHRGMGVNKAIIEALKEWAIAKGITEMQLEVYEGNLPAIQAYKRAGFETSIVTMRLPLSDNSIEEL